MNRKTWTTTLLSALPLLAVTATALPVQDLGAQSVPAASLPYLAQVPHTPMPPLPPSAMPSLAQVAPMPALRARVAPAASPHAAPMPPVVSPRLAPVPPMPPTRWAHEEFRSQAPEGWLQEDPGGRLYAAGREALNRRRYQDAARHFAALREEHPRSGYVADSYYWHAFALFRRGGGEELRRAAELLSVQAERHANAGTRRDADALRVRIEAQLAQRGDPRAAQAIAQQAAGPCDEGQEVRLAALSALLNMNEDQAVPILQELLRSRDECSVELRRRAVFLVAQKMDEASVDILLDLAHRDPDPDPEVREQAVFWLHQVRTPEALDALESILMESEDRELQEQAIFAISQRSGDRRAIEALRGYARRTDIPSDLRADAIFWISQNPNAGGAEYLIELYPQLEDPELRERAIFGIAQAGGDQAQEWLLERVRDDREPVEARKNALFWAGQIGGDIIEQLQGLYGTLEDREMKEQLIFVASQDGGRASVDFLMEVAREEEDGELRENAIFWLGQTDDPRVPEFLLSLVRGRG